MKIELPKNKPSPFSTVSHSAIPQLKGSATAHSQKHKIHTEYADGEFANSGFPELIFQGQTP